MSVLQTKKTSYQWLAMFVLGLNDFSFFLIFVQALNELTRLGPVSLLENIFQCIFFEFREVRAGHAPPDDVDLILTTHLQMNHCG